jgi:hypothetical protein
MFIRNMRTYGIWLNVIGLLESLPQSQALNKHFLQLLSSQVFSLKNKTISVPLIACIRKFRRGDNKTAIHFSFLRRGHGPELDQLSINTLLAAVWSTHTIFHPARMSNMLLALLVCTSILHWKVGHVNALISASAFIAYWSACGPAGFLLSASNTVWTGGAKNNALLASKPKVFGDADGF